MQNFGNDLHQLKTRQLSCFLRKRIIILQVRRSGTALRIEMQVFLLKLFREEQYQNLPKVIDK